eukprot:3655653-Prymnesium_polylepis.1
MRPAVLCCFRCSAICCACVCDHVELLDSCVLRSVVRPCLSAFLSEFVRVSSAGDLMACVVSAGCLARSAICRALVCNLSAIVLLFLTLPPVLPDSVVRHC